MLHHEIAHLSRRIIAEEFCTMALVKSGIAVFAQVLDISRSSAGKNKSQTPTAIKHSVFWGMTREQLQRL